jgi:phosphoglucosamine mutase
VTTTGDGIVAALQVLVALKDSGQTLAEFRSGMKKFPQRMINVTIAGKVNLADYPAVAASVARVEAQLGQRGRVLLRPSGTEPKIRVMVEGEDAAEVEALCAGLAADVERELA